MPGVEWRRRAAPGAADSFDPGQVLIVGESLVDVVKRTNERSVRHPGGSGANTAVALARLGRPVAFATAFADDVDGRSIAGHLSASGVTLAADPHVVARTSLAVARIGPDGSATYEFDLDWRLGPLPAGTPRMLHVGSLGAVLQPGCATVEDLVDHLAERTFVSYDVNARPSITGVGRDIVTRVERLAALCDLVKASDEDLNSLYPGSGVEGAARHLRELGAGAVVVTRGRDGASWFGAGEVVHVPGLPVTVADTIGAGDTFSAAMLDALWDDMRREPREVLEHAVLAATVTVSRPGADPPWRSELGGS